MSFSTSLGYNYKSVSLADAFRQFQNFQGFEVAETQGWMDFVVFATEVQQVISKGFFSEINNWAN